MTTVFIEQPLALPASANLLCVKGYQILRGYGSLFLRNHESLLLWDEEPFFLPREQGPFITKGTMVIALLGARCIYCKGKKGTRVLAPLGARALYSGIKGPLIQREQGSLLS